MTLRFAIPSKGTLYDGALAFLANCGMKISRTNPRRYTAGIRSMPEIEVLLHRPADVVEKIADGEIDIGISGLDLVKELRGDRDDPYIIFDDLGFAQCDLVVAVPETWIDVTSWRDLADLSAEFHAQGRSLRIATKYQALVRRFCYDNGINYFQLVDSRGATEAAPGLGYADIIADITETGTTLRDNQLKIVGGSLLHSQACLITSRANLRAQADRLETVRRMLELIEAYRRSRRYLQVVANVPGTSVEDVGRRVASRRELAGLQGPTVAPVWSSDPSRSDWYTVTIVTPQERMLAVVDHLRELGGNGMAVLQTSYVFENQSETYERLVTELA